MSFLQAWEICRAHSRISLNTHQYQKECFKVLNLCRHTLNYEGSWLPEILEQHKISPSSHGISLIFAGGWTSLLLWWSSSQKISFPLSGKHIQGKPETGVGISTAKTSLCEFFINALFLSSFLSSWTWRHSISYSLSLNKAWLFQKLLCPRPLATRIIRNCWLLLQHFNSERLV